MASSKCSVDGCKRNSDTLCEHCQNQVCTKHYIEHVKLANNELTTLSDEINLMVDKIQQQDLTHHVFEQIEQWREENHRRIDEICDEKKRQLKIEIGQNIDNHMKKLHELTREVKELIDEGDASFKQIEHIKNSIKKCREECKQFEIPHHFHSDLKLVNLNITLFNHELFRGDGTLLSPEHQLKLNEFYGKEGQIWTLIYKATRDGFSASDFHRCCDNQDSTITVIQSTEGGYLFGGYTSVSWRSTEGYVLDPNNPFLFTLTNPHGIPSTKYSNKHPNYSIYAGNNYGPTFGGAHDLYISNNSQTNRNNYFGFPHSYNDTTNRGALTFTGDQNFRTNEIEVYRLIET
ncbi:unnamed protein product [Rotaria sordida]|uniref:TLDc domain-containing protein n=1 Tax=Rotaria sordida TaxID=392033 RepID=A0A815DSV5_9BILA|nr:unnamed protein product [Rotaria sordida]CAF1301608.1 unnamed protein product [Rotaria sordida]